jgi:maleylpyruvate isomerase
MLRLYSYFRSSASYRVRIALNLKGLAYEYVPVHLVKGGGEQLRPEFQALNPSGLVPVLIDQNQVLVQSLAIIEYLEEQHPDPSLLPGRAVDRARIRSLGLTIACEIHPLNNLRVLRYLVKTLDVAEEAKNAWYRHWVEEGLAAVEKILANDPHTGRFCHGDAPTLADCCLAPQIFNAERFACRLDHLPTVMRVYKECMTLPAFQQAAPEAQPDAE